MHIIGIDFSIAETGFSCTNRKMEHTDLCVVRSSSKKGQGDAERFEEHTKNIMDKLEQCAPTLGERIVFMEDYAYAAPGQITRIAECCGVLKHKMKRSGIPSSRVVLVAPTMLKKFTTGKGNAQKDLMLLMAFKRWGVESTNNNEVDSFALMQMGVTLFRGPEKWTASEREQFTKLIDSHRKIHGDCEWLSNLFSGSLKPLPQKQPSQKRQQRQRKEPFRPEEVFDPTKEEATPPLTKKRMPLLRKISPLKKGK